MPTTADGISSKRTLALGKMLTEQHQLKGWYRKMPWQD